MNSLNDSDLLTIQGGGDSYATDIGQFLGGTAGWMRANSGLYAALGPGFGGLAAILAGFNEASR